MKPQPTTRDPSEKEGSSPSQPRPARRDATGGKESVYNLRVSYYATMKPQRVYPLVVEVARGPGPAEGPTGATVTLRPVVPGALVVPAELPLDVSRPGSPATFHVTPVAKGRLPEARVRVFHDGRQVQELRTRMTAKTQRTTWVLLLAALILPPLLAHWFITAKPGDGWVPVESRRAVAKDARAKDDAARAKAAEEPEKPAEPAKGGGGAPALPLPPPPPPPPPADAKPDPHKGFKQVSPGGLLEYRVDEALFDVLPNFPYSDEVVGGVARAAGVSYDALCDWSKDLYLPCWVAVGFLILAVGSWSLHRPTRVRIGGSVALPRPLAGHGFGQTGETLPLARPQEDL